MAIGVREHNNYTHVIMFQKFVALYKCIFVTIHAFTKVSQFISIIMLNESITLIFIVIIDFIFKNCLFGKHCMYAKFNLSSGDWRFQNPDIFWNLNT